MSKKLVIPTLETQQKYPLFYAEATKTINDIIEHISKERGIYTSNIEPDPKEHLIWFNTNFNIIYFYDEKTKSFLPTTGGGGDLSTIITLIDNLRKEIGNHDNWNDDASYGTIYKALDGLQTQIQDINFTIIPVHTVSDKSELFDIDFDRGVYKIEEHITDGNIKNYYILTVSGKRSAKNYKLYGGGGIFIQKTIDGVKQFVQIDLTKYDILEIIGDSDTDLSFMHNYSILTYLSYINDTFDIDSFNNLVGHDEDGRKVAEMFTDLQILVNNIDADKQNKVDNSLTTTNKTIVGAINELHSLILALQK